MKFRKRPRFRKRGLETHTQEIEKATVRQRRDAGGNTKERKSNVGRWERVL